VKETAMNAINLHNDLTALFDKREDLKSKIDDLQKELKIVNNSLKDQFEETAKMQLAQANV
jgi:regulator of replication initiation timing